MVVIKGWLILLLTLCAWISYSNGLKCMGCKGAGKDCTKRGKDGAKVTCSGSDGKTTFCYEYAPNKKADSGNFARHCFKFSNDDKYWKKDTYNYRVAGGSGRFPVAGQVRICNTHDACNNQGWENITAGDSNPTDAQGPLIPAGHPDPETDDDDGAMSIQPGNLVIFLTTWLTTWLLIKNLN